MLLPLFKDERNGARTAVKERVCNSFISPLPPTNGDLCVPYGVEELWTTGNCPEFLLLPFENRVGPFDFYVPFSLFVD